MANPSDLNGSSHEADLKRAAQLTQEQQRMAMAKQMEDRAIMDKRMAEEKMAQEKQMEQQRNNEKKGDELDRFVMGATTGLLLFAGFEATKDGVKNMLDPKTTASIAGQNPHAEMTPLGATSPSGIAGGIGQMFGFDVGAGQSSSLMNARKPGSDPVPGMSMSPS
jgi:hypothetical protein